MGAGPRPADEPPPRSLADLIPETRASWYPEFDRFFRPYVPLFDLDGTGRTAEQARRYPGGLLGPEEVKSMEPIAQRTATPYHRTQHFITDSPWPTEIVQIAFAKEMGGRFASPNGILALDDEGDPKKGDASVGVYRQYCGNRGKEENCQVAVSLSYVRPHPERYADMESFGMGMQLYLPKERAEDPVHRKKTHVPEKIAYEPKWRIGLGLIDRALSLRLPHRAMVADADYGRAGEFRRALRDRKEAYVLGVQPTQTEVAVLGKDGRLSEPPKLSEVAPGLPEKAWKSVVWSQGTKGPLRMEAARLRAKVCVGGGAHRGGGLGGLRAAGQRDEGLRDLGAGRVGAAGPGGADPGPVGDRALVRAREERVGVGPVRGADVAGMASQRDHGDAGPRIPDGAEVEGEGEGEEGGAASDLADGQAGGAAPSGVGAEHAHRGRRGSGPTGAVADHDGVCDGTAPQADGGRTHLRFERLAGLRGRSSVVRGRPAGAVEKGPGTGPMARFAANGERRRVLTGSSLQPARTDPGRADAMGRPARLSK